MCDKINKSYINKAKRHCGNYNTKNKKINKKNIYTNNVYTWVLNLLAVALLIQHVAWCAQASEHASAIATTTATITPGVVNTTKVSVTSPLPFITITPTILMVKRNVESISETNNKNNQMQTRIEFASRATSRHLSGIEVPVGVSSSSKIRNAGGDGADFAAYMNDFNMQAEAAIPEDILDQQHIQDIEDGIDADSIQYVEESDVDADADGEATVAEPEADIVLAAQKFSTLENSRDYKENYKQRKNRVGGIDEYLKENIKKQNTDLKYKEDNDGNNNKDNINSKNNSVDSDVINEEPLALPSMSDAKKSSILKEQQQQNHKLITEGEESDVKVVEDVTEQQMQFIENLAAEKFNKAPSQTAQNVNKETCDNNKQKNNFKIENNFENDVDDYIFADRKHDNNNVVINKNNNNNLSKQVNNKSEMQRTDGNQEEEVAIGDIEDDKFYNEDEDEDDDKDEGDDETQQFRKRGIGEEKEFPEKLLEGTYNSGDNDAHFKFKTKLIPRKIKRHERAESFNENKNVDEKESNNNKKHTYKRHDYGDPDENKDSPSIARSYTQARIEEKVGAISKNQPQHHQQKQHHIDTAIDSIESDNEDDGSGGGVVDEADYSITYFGILTNNSKNHGKSLEEVKGEEEVDEDINGRKEAKNSVKSANNVDANVNSHGVATQNKVESQQQQHRHETLSQTYANYNAHSAFEHFKQLRRQSQRYGHKVNKKKYKDYLRYATAYPLTRRSMAIASDTETAVKTSTISLENNNNNTYSNKSREPEQQRAAHATDEDTFEREEKHAEKLRKYARKIVEEKLHGLPASPIFIVNNRKHDVKDEKPFYEGQINYFLETSDEVNDNNDDDNDDVENMAKLTKHKVANDRVAYLENGSAELSSDKEERIRAHERTMERMIAADNNNWYRRVSPMLRNGVKMLNNNNKEAKEQHNDAISQQKQQQQQVQHHQHHNRNNKHHHHQHHHRQRNPFNRKEHHSHEHHYHHHNQQHHSQKQQQHHHRHIGSNIYRKQKQEHQHKLIPNVHELEPPPSPHAADTKIAIKMGLVQTPIPPPFYTTNNTTAKQSKAKFDVNTSPTIQMGHQITELEEFERYYAKWPHLARVQFQVNDEHYREAHPELYPETKDNIDEDEDYDLDYESAAELEEAQSGHGEDANLPPYIKKYNRRNKQLLNLLEGTLPPSTTRIPPTNLLRSWSSSVLQPGPHAASSRSAGGGASGRIRIDDDYLKEKRKRYHNREIVISSINSKATNGKEDRHHHFEDLFAQQRATLKTNTSDTEDDDHHEMLANRENSTMIQSKGTIPDKTNAVEISIAKSHATNHLPDEDVSVSVNRDEYTETADNANSYAGMEVMDAVGFWQKEIENKSNANELSGSASQMAWQIEKLTTSSNSLHSTSPPLVPSTPKSLIFRLPSYPGIAATFAGKPRSRSAHFAPSGGSRGTLAFVSTVNGDLHNNNRLSNIYGKGGGDDDDDDGGGVVNSGGMVSIGAATHHKSLSRFSPYKASVHMALTAENAAASLAAVNSDDNALGTTKATATSTPTSVSIDGEGEYNASESDATNNSGGHTISSFVYHRVIDASPRLVGTGATGRKQRLPFVAITDRRLETTKKEQLEREKEFEQNHYPMP